MSTSIGEQIVVAMVAALNGVGKPCTTYRSRVDALAASELPAFVLYSVDEMPVLKSQNVVERTRTIRLEIMVEGEPPADVALDPLYVYAVQALRADATLNAHYFIRALRETKIQWDVAASYEDAAVALIDFEVVFVTTTDPTVRVDG